MTSHRQTRHKKHRKHRTLRKGKGRTTRPNVDVLSSMFDQMKMGERKHEKVVKDDVSKLENLFSRLGTSSAIKKRRTKRSRGSKKSRREARESRKSVKMET
jgi:hypothetical protein